MNRAPTCAASTCATTRVWAPTVRACTLALLACAPSAADRSATSVTADDIDEAWTTCPDDPCRVEVVARFAAWPRCADLGDPWDDECRFRQAEALERAGRPAEALDACRDTAFAMGCGTHVLGQAARRADTIAAADVTWATLSTHADPRLAFSYWRAFYRAGIDRGTAPGLEACAGSPCRKAGEREIEATVHQLGIPCGVDRPPPPWIPADSPASNAAWITSVEKLCTRGEAGVPVRLQGPGHAPGRRPPG